ncbi:MAG: ankyrin repeat domain-containing protein, partial [Cyanobacteriota bacterium]
MLDRTHLFSCFLLTTLSISCSQSPEISVIQQSAIASTNPITQQVSSTTKNSDTPNKIAQNFNATVKQNETHNQILLEAIENQDLEGVKAALANGADANADNPAGITALMFAAMNGNLDIFNALLEAGADVNLDSGEGETALMYAAVGGHLEIAQIL